MGNKLYITLAGLKGSGKTTLAAILEKDYAANVFRLGGYVDNYIMSRGLLLDPENKRRYAQQLVEESPLKSVAYYLAQEISLSDGITVIDSAVSEADYHTMCEISKGAMHSLWYVQLTNPSMRYENILIRARDDDSKTIDELREFELNHVTSVSGLRDSANFIVMNSGYHEEFRYNVKQVLHEIRTDL